MSPVAQHPFLQHDGPIPFVHRGGPITYPENSMAAFEHAYRLGFRYFETDVHATFDDVLVACHDDSLRRLTGDDRPIASMTGAQIDTLRINGEPLASLPELLHAFPDVRINIDPKSDRAVRPLAQLLRQGDLLDRVCCASFSGNRLRYLRAALGARLCSSAAPGEIARAKFVTLKGGRPTLPGVNVLQVPVGPRRLRLLSQNFIARAHESGLPVHVWTLNSRSAIEALLDFGVDGVMSDDPELLKDIFGERGHWPRDTRN